MEDLILFLPPASVASEGYVFTCVCLFTGARGVPRSNIFGGRGRGRGSQGPIFSDPMAPTPPPAPTPPHPPPPPPPEIFFENFGKYFSGKILEKFIEEKLAVMRGCYASCGHAGGLSCQLNSQHSLDYLSVETF